MKNNSEDNLNKLIAEAKTALTNVINNHKKNFTDLTNNVYTFIDLCTNSINKLKDYEKVGIDYYYRVKEIFNKINITMDSFNDKLAIALDSEFLLLQSYVNDEIYMGEIDALIDNVEEIWNIFKNNEILKETITNGHADEIVKKLESVRKTYEDLKNTFLNKVKSAYENFKNTIIKNGYTDVQNMKKNLNDRENTLIELIKTKLKYLTNYEKYNEDIKKITKIENEMSTIKLNAYQTYINDNLNEITTDSFLSSTTISNLKVEIENEVAILINNIKDNKINDFKTNFKNILSKFTEISSSSNIENIINNIKNRFSTDNLKNLLSNYYNYVNDNGVSKYSTLVDEITEKSLDIYISEPVELINKIKGMTIDTDKNTERENNKLQKIVTEKMQNILNDVISRIKNIINSEINYVKGKIDSKILRTTTAIITTGEFYTNSYDLISDLDNSNSNYLSKLDFSLDLKTIIQEKEEEINSKISEVAEKLRQDFYYLFCYEKDTLNTSCPNAEINRMDPYDTYYFQLSKFRDALNHLTLLQPYIDDVINDDNLKDLSVDDFVNLYKNPNNFDVNTVAGQVRNYLEVLRKEGINNTKSNVNSLKDVIKKSFSSGINLTEIIYKNFFNKLFSIKDDLEEDLDKVFLEIQRITRNATTEEIKNQTKYEFFIDVSNTDLETEFNITWENYSNQLTEKKMTLLNNMVLNGDIEKKLIEIFEDKIYNDINNYRRELILNMTGKPFKTCILLDNEITLTDIVEEAIIELKNDISSNIKKNLTSQFKAALKDFSVEFEPYFKVLHDNIQYQYRYFYDVYYNEMAKNSTIASKNRITTLTDAKLFMKGLKDGIKFCLEELENILKPNSICNPINNKEKEKEVTNLLNDIFGKISLKIPNSLLNININIDKLVSTCETEFKREKDSFKDQILEYIILGFSNTITNFMKGAGKSYLDGIFLDDYDVNIVPKIDYIHSQVKEIDEYLYLIIEGLFDFDSYLTDSVKEVYYQLMNFINDGITTTEIDAKILKKIEQFKYDSADKIVDYFNDYTLNILSSNSFRIMFSEQVQNLLPTYVPHTLTLNFSMIYKELLDSSYLSNLKKIYKNNIIEKRNNIIEELKTLQLTRSLQIGEESQGFSSSNIATPTVEYNKLNATLSEMKNKFSLELTDKKKQFVKNILSNSTLKNYLIKIPNDYNQAFDTTQNNIINNVKLTLNLTQFNKKIDELINTIGKENPYEQAEKIREEFFVNLSKLYDNLTENVTEEYKLQSAPKTEILPIDDRRRLEENVDIEIESIQAMINLIDIRIVNLIQNISNNDEIINITSQLNQINNIIDVHLINLDNTMESYLKYLRYYLKLEGALQNYQNNITKIYTAVENKLNGFFNLQIDKINSIYYSLNNYKLPYIDEVKPKIVEKINIVVKDISKKLIKKYLNDHDKKGEKKFTYFKKTDLTNLGGLNSVLGSTRLNYSVAVQNTALQWSYDFKKDENNSKVNLDVNAGGYSDATITYGNEFYNTSIAGTFGKGLIGMNMTTNFSNHRVYIDYYTKYENYSYTQTLYELTTLDSWGVCEDAVDCFVGRNDDYCPYIVRVEDGNKTIVKPESNDLGNYKDSSYYLFTGYYENSLCTFANYFYSAEETKYGFNSTIARTV